MKNIAQAAAFLLLTSISFAGIHIQQGDNASLSGLTVTPLSDSNSVVCVKNVAGVNILCVDSTPVGPSDYALAVSSQDGTPLFGVNGTGLSAINSGITITSSPVIMGSFNATCNNTVLLASSTLALTSNIMLPPASSCPGHVIKWWRLDMTTAPAILDGNGADTVNSTTTLVSYAKGQGCNLISDGVNNWYPDGKCALQGAVAGQFAYTSGNAVSMPASSDTVSGPFYNDVPINVCAIRTYTLVASGNENAGVWDQYGTLMISTGPVTTSGASTTYLLATPVYLPAGVFEKGIQISNVIATYFKGTSLGTLGCYVNTAGTLTLPTWLRGMELP